MNQQMVMNKPIIMKFLEQASARGLLVYLDQQRFRLVTRDDASELVSDCHELLPREEGQL